MIRVIGIGGSPCTGKSTVMRTVLLAMPGLWIEDREGALAWVRSNRYRVAVLGEYTGSPLHWGADRLSMAAQPKALATLLSWARDPCSHGLVVLFEGNQLFNESFIRWVKAEPMIQAHWIMLTASPDVLTGRHHNRRYGYSWLYLEGQEAKARRLKELFPGIEKTRHEYPPDTETVVRHVRDLIAAPFPDLEGPESHAGPAPDVTPALFM